MTGFQSGRLFSVSAAVVLAALTFVAPADRANALTLQLTQGLNTVTTNDGVTPGLAQFIGALGTYIVNVSTGISDPILGSPAAPHMDLNSVNVAGPSGGVLTIMLSDTGFNGTGGLISFLHQIGGTVTGGSVSVKTYFDASNTLFGTGTLLSSFAFGTSPFSNAATGVGLSLLTPYSLTQVVTLTLGGGGIASFNSELQATPIPAACRCSPPVSVRWASRHIGANARQWPPEGWLNL